MVYVEVEGVLKAGRDGLRPGQILRYIEPGADFEAFGHRLCMTLVPARSTPAVGERLFLFGRKYRPGADLLGQYHVFPLRGDLILPQPYLLIEDRQPVPLHLVAAALTVPEPSPAPAPQGGRATRILWGDGSRTQAWFVPEAVLNSRPLADQPFLGSSRETLEHQLELRRNPPAPHPLSQWRHGFPDCFAFSTFNRDPLAGARSIAEATSSPGVVVVGEVTESFPGWDLALDRAATAVFLDVEQVLKSDRQVGSEVVFVIPGADFHLAGLRLCELPVLPEGSQRIGLSGQRLLVLGEGSPGAADQLGVRVAFVMDGELVLPQHTEYLRDRQPVPLSTIIEFIRSAREGRRLKRPELRVTYLP